MFPGRTLVLLGLGLCLFLITLSVTAAGVLKPAIDFPLSVDSYHDQQIPSVPYSGPSRNWGKASALGGAHKDVLACPGPLLADDAGDPKRERARARAA